MTRPSNRPSLPDINELTSVRPSILVVDDSEENVEVLSNLLIDHFDVSVALDGLTALQLLEELPIDLVLLDVNMPGIDGYETCRRIKANPATSDIPVIFVTAMNDFRDEARGFAVGACDYITKPFDPVLVSARVANYFALRKANKTLIRQRAQIDGERRKRKGVEDSRDDLLNKLLHDLRAPLDLITATAERLPSGPGGELAEVARQKREIAAALTTLRQTMDTCLEVSRLDMGKSTLSRSPCDVGLLLLSVANTMRKAWAGRAITVTDTSAGATPTIDAARFLRVFREMIDRSMRRTSPGGSIDVRVQVVGEWLLVTVAEEGGSGAPSPEASDVDGPREVAEAFCHLIFEAHGGGAVLRPASAGATASHLGIIPLRGSTAQGLSEAPSNPVALARHVLLVARDETLPSVLGAALATTGWKVSRAGPSATDVLRNAVATRPALVVVDEGSSTIEASTLASSLARVDDVEAPRVVALSSTHPIDRFLAGWPTFAPVVPPGAVVVVPRDLPLAMLRTFFDRLAIAPAHALGASPA